MQSQYGAAFNHDPWAAGYVETFAEEFFWLVDSAGAALQAAGFTLIAVKQFSQLSWGICVERTA